MGGTKNAIRAASFCCRFTTSFIEFDVMVAKRSVSFPTHTNERKGEIRSTVCHAIIASRKTLTICLTRLAPVDRVVLASITHSASRSGVNVALHLQGDTIDDGLFESTRSLNYRI